MTFNKVVVEMNQSPLRFSAVDNCVMKFSLRDFFENLDGMNVLHSATEIQEGVRYCRLYDIRPDQLSKLQFCNSEPMDVNLHDIFESLKMDVVMTSHYDEYFLYDKIFDTEDCTSLVPTWEYGKITVYLLPNGNGGEKLVFTKKGALLHTVDVTEFEQKEEYIERLNQHEDLSIFIDENDLYITE